MSAPVADVVIRNALPADARQIAEAHVASWRTTYADVVPAEYLAGLSVDAREQQWRQRITRATEPGRRECILVAAHSADDIFGFVSAGPRVEGPVGFDGEIYSFYLIEQAQRRGIGRRLVCAAATHLLAAGMTSLSLWALATNPSRGFYERMGGKLIETTSEVIGEAELEMYGYGWNDISALLQR